MADWKALCEELANYLQGRKDREIGWPGEDLEQDLLDRVHSLLAEPVGEGPTDEELFRIASDCAALYIADDRDYDNCSEVVAAMRGAIAADRSRFGRQPAPPPAGEVEELEAWLRSTGEGQPCLSDEGYARLTRAADLLEQRQLAPVPVAERLPGPEDCDEEGRCWLLTVEDEYPQWRLHSIEGSQPGGATMIWVPVDSSPGVMVDAFYASHWLPAHALPLPSGEVQP